MLLRDHPVALEADFAQYYPRDADQLPERFTGRLTVRRAAVLASQLPPGARVWREMGVDGGWTSTEHLLAVAIDTLAWANWQRGGDEHARKPKSIPRPGDARRERERIEKQRMRGRRFLARHPELTTT